MWQQQCRRPHLASAFLAATVVASFAALPARADYAITPFNLPGATLTYDIWDINDSGQLVGSADFSGRTAGYIYDAGFVTTLYGPRGAVGANALGISNNGIVVGDWWSGTEPQSTFQPFVYSMATGRYTLTSLSLPGNQYAQARGVSPDGRYLTGYFTNAIGGSNGFVWDLIAGQLAADIDAGADFMIAQGINSFGQVVGNYKRYETGVESAFVYDLGTAKRADFSFSGVDVLAARGINDQGQIAGWLYRADSPVVEAWIGNPGGYQIISFGASKDTYGEGINNLGQVVGILSDPATGQDGPGFTASPVALPIGVTGGGGGDGEPAVPHVYTFSAAVVADLPIFIDPLVAVGYEYRIGTGNPLFKTVSLPAGIGDNVFDIEVGGQHFTVHGNEIFDFTTHGFSDGVEAFSVHGIEPQAMLDPANPQAFITRLTFNGNGTFTGTQTVLTVDFTPSVPEPASWGLMCLGLAALGTVARQRSVRCVTG